VTSFVSSGPLGIRPYRQEISILHGDPWDPKVVLQRFTREDETRPSSSESSCSILGAEDWKRIERLLKQVVNDVYNQKTEKLSSTMHHLATESILLKLHCGGLENALQNEKKKRQRGKRLYFNCGR
jgi:hypothetical protein